MRIAGFSSIRVALTGRLLVSAADADCDPTRFQEAATELLGAEAQALAAVLDNNFAGQDMGGGHPALRPERGLTRARALLDTVEKLHGAGRDAYDEPRLQHGCKRLWMAVGTTVRTDACWLGS